MTDMTRVTAEAVARMDMLGHIAEYGCPPEAIPDPTTSVGPWCDEMHDSSGSVCTMPAGQDHDWHVAGDGDFVVAVWKETP